MNKTKRCKLGVIMPIYNSQKYLQVAIDSILNQKFQDFILYLVDDGSTDKSVEMIKKFQKTYPNKIVALKTPNRMGRGLWVFNWAQKEVDHEYLAIADSDDLYRDDRFLHQINFLDHNKSYFAVGTSGSIIDESENIIESYRVFEKFSDIYKKMFNAIVVRNPTICLRKKMLKGQDYFVPGCDSRADWWSACIHMMNGRKYANLDMNLHGYRQHPNNYSKIGREIHTRAIKDIFWARLKLLKMGYRPSFIQILRSFIYFSISFLIPKKIYLTFFDSTMRLGILKNFDSGRMYSSKEFGNKFNTMS